MLDNYIYMLSLNEFLNDLSDKFNHFMGNFTENATVASLVTLALFIALVIFVGGHVNK